MFADNNHDFMRMTSDQSYDRYTTTSKDSFSEKHIQAENAMKTHKFSKYKILREKQPMMLSYGERDNIPSSYTQKLASAKTTSSRGLFDYTIPNHRGEDVPHFTTESSKILGERVNKDQLENIRNKLRSSDAPIAMGRSGNRVEKGLSTTGLMGERLMTNCDKSKDSFVQRTWLYHEDPALSYKVNGVPKNTATPMNVSLSIGKNDEMLMNSHYVKAGADFRKRYHITAGPLSRGVQCGVVFMDDPTS